MPMARPSHGDVPSNEHLPTQGLGARAGGKNCYHERRTAVGFVLGRWGTRLGGRGRGGVGRRRDRIRHASVAEQDGEERGVPEVEAQERTN